MTRQHRSRIRSGALAAAAFFIILPVTAQDTAAQAVPTRVVEDAPCHWGGDDDTDRYCEEREYTLDARSELSVDAGQNGGITVAGWDRNEVRLVAKIQATSRDGDARDLADEIEIRTGATIEADGPQTWGRRGGWSTSFELMVPRATELRLRASNGGIRLAELTGEVNAATTNGGIHLVGSAGRVEGETTNGGLHLELTGDRWTGGGVDLRTTNGGVEITVPDEYSADLEIATVNGGMRLDIPVMVQGRLDRRIRTQLGGGGALIRATTTNGGVVVRR